MMSLHHRRFQSRTAGKSSLFVKPCLVPKSFYSFVFEGLGYLLEHLLISNARYIRSANASGIKKMMRNILALQQNLKMITQSQQETELERAKRFYSLFYMTPQVSERIKHWRKHISHFRL